MNGPLTRRELIQAGTAAGLALGMGTAMAGPAPSMPLRVGVIGVGGRGTYLLSVALSLGVEVPAVCDINEAHLNRALELVAKARGRKPEGYSRGPTDYRRMLQRDDLDAVIVATPIEVHAPMAIDSLRAGKHVLSEVAAAMTLDECWGLVRAAEETGRIYMLSENCCYWEPVMMVLQMVQKGVFGELTYAECGYVHDCRSLMFQGDQLTWRGEMKRDYTGNLYPTHAIGPVAQWLGIHRGDRFVSLVASATGQRNILDFVRRKFPKDHPAHEIKFREADSVSTLIRTAKGVLVDLRYDTSSPRPVVSTTYYSLQGTRASYESRGATIWIEGRSPGHTWEPAAKYAQEFEHPLWKAGRAKAAGAGHGGGDYFVVNEFFETVRSGRPSPIDACDAAAWSAIIELSARSIAAGGAPQEFPDFTRGRWEKSA